MLHGRPQGTAMQHQAAPQPSGEAAAGRRTHQQVVCYMLHDVPIIGHSLQRIQVERIV
jgi:hypothetical protein